MQTISWKEKQGNPFVRAIHPFMLSPDGMVVKENCKVKAAPRVQMSEWRNVTYDKDFVVSKLRNALQPLAPLGSEVIVALVGEAIADVGVDTVDCEAVESLENADIV
ncbi:MAG TPA: hypothetical protein V6C65_18895 [Allocoleopsis sp.]